MQALRLTLIVAALAVTAPLSAQQGPPGGRPGGMGGDPAAMQRRQDDRLFEGITLTAEQRIKVDSIQAASRARQQELMQAGGMRDPETRQKMIEQRQATMAAVRALLTAEQQAKFDANAAAIPAQRGGRRPPR